MGSVLTHLSISNLTLVDQLDLEFSAGMSVITGETGAGKSILLGALGLALGDRADSSMVSPGTRKAEVGATFDLTDHPFAINWLDDRDLGDGDQCILRRVVGADGRSRAFINGSPTTLSELKALSETLLDIHSQHEHQSLLKKEVHIRLLDEYGGLTEVVDDVSALHNDWHKLRQSLTGLINDSEEKSARVQLLSYQAEELQSLALTAGETTTLEGEQKRLSVADETQMGLVEIQRLCAFDEDGSASSQASKAQRILESFDDESLKPIREMLDAAVIQLDEAMHDLSGIAEKFTSDPERLREVEQRLSLIYETARKHRVNPDELIALTDQISAELDDINNADERIAQLESDALAAEANFRNLAEKLSKSRKQSAQLLQSEVTAQLQALGMDGSTFTIKIDPDAVINASGVDSVEFLVATIPGSEPGSLARIASGGELSRISLAIQVVTAKTSSTPTLVFDEVDVGVGGATAEVIGALLRQLGADAQIVCVTHLPQVAAQGHQHYVVVKSTTANGASTTVTRLSETEKVDEIARMLGGIEKTDQSLAHAQAMISGVDR